MREPTKSELSHNNKEENDLDLVQYAVQGDRDAFDILVTRYRDRVFNLARQMLKDSDAAEDIAQEVFVRAYRGLRNFRRESKFFTWLYRIAVNLVYTQAKREARRREIYHEVYSDMKPIQTMSLESPEDCAVSGELSHMISQVIKELDPRFRQVLILREIEELDVAEVSSILKLPKGTVKSRLFRAREDLRKRLSALKAKEEKGE